MGLIHKKCTSWYYKENLKGPYNRSHFPCKAHKNVVIQYMTPLKLALSASLRVLEEDQGERLMLMCVWSQSPVTSVVSDESPQSHNHHELSFTHAANTNVSSLTSDQLFIKSRLQTSRTAGKPFLSLRNILYFTFTHRFPTQNIIYSLILTLNQ